MAKKNWLKMGALMVFAVCGISMYEVAQAQKQDPKHPPVAGDGSLVVQLCDGKTNVTVPGVDPNTRLTKEQAQAVSSELMKLWMTKQDPAVAARWMSEASRSAAAEEKKPEPASGQTGNQAQEQVTPVSPRDFMIWDREVAREVAYGDQIFHDDKLIGSTNGIACAMCHPNASNTHPETYPKFQVQLQKVALLRDMINWCIEQPTRGKRLDADDPKMRALEAYILSQRKGVPMAPGKH
ncbi:MAG: cytochrome C [Blastocatellia bacterium]|nr:cytochrome C [Blastocatellia bacterium]